VTVDGAQIKRPARPAARAEDIEPRRSGAQRGPDGGRPQHVATGGEALIPAVDDELGLGARSPVRPKLHRAGLDVEPLCPNTIAPVSACRDQGIRRGSLQGSLRTFDPELQRLPQKDRAAHGGNQGPGLRRCIGRSGIQGEQALEIKSFRNEVARSTECLTPAVKSPNRGLACLPLLLSGHQRK
jgi:hypothetical protein